MILPWSTLFAPPLVGELRIDRDELEQLEVSGRYRTAYPHSFRPRLHPASAPLTWPAPSVTLVRPVTCNGVHVVSQTNRIAR
jgi:hypothetical protein